MKRKMNKHLARLCLCLMLVYLFVPVLSIPVHAEEEKCWVLQEVLVDTHGDVYERAGETLTSYEEGYVKMHVERDGNTIDITPEEM